MRKFEIDNIEDFQIDDLAYTEPLKEELIEKINLKNYIVHNLLNLISSSFEEKLSVSFAIAQSTKLSYFEDEIESKISILKRLPYEMQQTGKINWSGEKISKMIGDVFLKSAEVNFDFDMLDEPDYFWEHDT